MVTLDHHRKSQEKLLLSSRSSFLTGKVCLILISPYHNFLNASYFVYMCSVLLCPESSEDLCLGIPYDDIIVGTSFVYNFVQEKT